MALQRRLLQDIAEFKSHPYPNIKLFMQDDLQTACLLLTPSRKEPLHLTIVFGEQYPLQPPKVTIQSKIEHPNVFDNYICASILNTAEGYTPAYTLKGIAIQLLSFFSSERIEQGGGYSINLTEYRRYSPKPRRQTDLNEDCGCVCSKCGFGGRKLMDKDLVVVGQRTLPNPFAEEGRDSDPRESAVIAQSVLTTNRRDGAEINGQLRKERRPSLIERILGLPDELLLLVLGELDTKDLLAAAKVCSKIGDFMNSYDTIRMRELQCFCFKENFMRAKLGVGVHVWGRGRQGCLESEFDLLSQQAFDQFHVRRSVQGLEFEHWLPLPLSRRHWTSVSADANKSLVQLARAANIRDCSGFNINVIYNFMNRVVVKLCNEAEQSWDGPKSTLTHASEKAVESYFGVFHLLLCLATEHRLIVQEANHNIRRFLDGDTSKEAFPDLGQLVVALLVSDQGLTEDLALAIIKEAILRNVVWMLNRGMPELSYIEPSASSNYRLQKTFEAGKTSYRLLMFQALFYRNARASGKPISAICDDLFDLHGAPPKGTAERMAADIRNIRTVDKFPEFFKLMGLTQAPSKENFCAFLKRTIEDSVKKGYSCWPISQGQALGLRKIKEPSVEVAKGVVQSWIVAPKVNPNFFPKKAGRGRR